MQLRIKKSGVIDGGSVYYDFPKGAEGDLVSWRVSVRVGKRIFGKFIGKTIKRAGVSNVGNALDWHNYSHLSKHRVGDATVEVVHRIKPDAVRVKAIFENGEAYATLYTNGTAKRVLFAKNIVIRGEFAGRRLTLSAD